MTSPRTRFARLSLAALAVGLATTLAACTTASESPGPTPSADNHGHVDGAEEVSEPQLSLVFGGSDGALGLLDLRTEERTPLLGPAAGNARAVVGDGRFISRVDESAGETTVELVDSGAWTVAHGDHFHHHRAEPRVIGSVRGEGPAVVRSADRRTAITFPESGGVVVLAHDDLEDGVLGEPIRLTISPHPGALVLPFAGALLSAEADAASALVAVQAISDDGSRIQPPQDCPGASSATTTRAGAVFSCSDGAVLATRANGVIALEKIPYPAEIDAPPADALFGRGGRPSVAGVAGAAGAWRLNAREREWTFLASEDALVAVSAVSDDEELTVAVDGDGAVRVLGAAGAVLGQTEPLLSATIADPAARAALRLVVDAQHAYVSDPAQSRILEIDYRDRARVTRAFAVPEATFLEQVG